MSEIKRVNWFPHSLYSDLKDQSIAAGNIMLKATVLGGASCTEDVTIGNIYEVIPLTYSNCAILNDDGNGWSLFFMAELEFTKPEHYKSSPSFDFNYDEEIMGSEVRIDVHFCVHGKDEPETMTDPEQKAELELLSVKMNGDDLLSSANEEQVNYNTERAREHLEELKQDKQANGAEV